MFDKNLAICQHKLHKLFCAATSRLDSFQFGSFFFSIETHAVHQFFQFGKGQLIDVSHCHRRVFYDGSDKFIPLDSAFFFFASL